MGELEERRQPIEEQNRRLRAAISGLEDRVKRTEKLIEELTTQVKRNKTAIADLQKVLHGQRRR